MSTVKVFKRGEVLYKEGDKAQLLFLIQSGSVQLQLVRQKQTIELCTLGGTQIVGEHALAGVATHPHSAIALTEVKAIELPVDGVKAQIEAGSQLQKLLTKSLCDKLKVIMKDCQSMRLERDNTPCPSDQTAKIFGVLFHVAKAKGETSKDKPGIVSVNWQAMRQYAQRVFMESPKRLQMALNIFVKLGWAKLEMVKAEDNPDGPEELGTVHFSDLAGIEQFFEFFQYYHFKGGKQELLKTDERAMQMAHALIELAAGETPDRNGSVKIEYAKVIEKLKANMGIQLNNDHWALLENKGLLVKRESGDKGVFLQFELKEFERTEKIWKVLREVERWNEKGSVDPNEPVETKKASKAGPCCPDCGHGFEGAAPKFCSECGHKFTAAA